MLRALSRAPAWQLGRRLASTGAPRHTFGVYVDNTFPIRLGLFDVRYLVAAVERESLLATLKGLIPRDSAYQSTVDDVVERAKDGGAFVRMSFSLPTDPFADPADQVDDAAAVAQAEAILLKEVKEAIAVAQYRPWWSWRANRVFPVRGKLWLEDLNRFPSRTLRVEFEGPELPQEELYEAFRPYGKLHDITPQPAASKDLPRYAEIAYESIRSAAAARNCLHAAKLVSTNGATTPTFLRILFVPRTPASHYARDWITSHPRIMLPLFVVVFGTLASFVFDPIRELFVKGKIEGNLEARNWRIVSWLKRETLGRLGLSMQTKAVSETGLERERATATALMDGWLRDAPDTFIVLTGPRGSGKGMLLSDVMAERSNVLMIDCESICKAARTEDRLVQELASAVGYFPQFAFLSSLNNLVDLASVGLIGQKAGFTSTVQNQLKSILEITATALKSLAEETNRQRSMLVEQNATLLTAAEERSAFLHQIEHEGVKDGRIDCVAGSGMMAELGGGMERDDEKLIIVGPLSAAKARAFCSPADPTRPEDLKLPVVIVRGFAVKVSGDNKLEEILYDALADWAALLVENQVAHVIFTAPTATALSKSLAKALPTKPFNTLSLNDASPDAAFDFISTQLQHSSLTGVALGPEAKPFVEKLGGRRTDLELLLIKLRSGQALPEAVNEIVGRAAIELRKNFFEDPTSGEKKRWTRSQAWALVKGLAKSGELKYADSLVTTFKNDEAALRELEAAELISIHHVNGRPSLIHPSKPVYLSAFDSLVKDHIFCAAQDYLSNASAIVKAEQELSSASKELIELATLFNPVTGGAWKGNAVPSEIVVGAQRLLAKMKEAEEKLEKLEQDKERLLTVFKNEE